MTEIQIARGNALSTQLVSLDAGISSVAEANIDAQIEGMGYSAVERRSMIVAEELTLINGLDLYSILARGKRLDIIENERLHALHPNGYATVEELALAVGVSKGELSQTRDLCRIIFPYLAEQNINIVQVFTDMGKSKFRELTPLLKAVILNEEPNVQTTREAFERIMGEVRDTFEQAGMEYEDSDVITEAVEQLLILGQTQTVREIRQTTRPVRTPNIPAVAINTSAEERIIVARVTNEQWEMFNNMIGDKVDMQPGDVRHAATLAGII